MKKIIQDLTLEEQDDLINDNKDILFINEYDYVLDEKIILSGFRFFQKSFNELKLERCQEIRLKGKCVPLCLVNEQWIENCLICGYSTRKPKKTDIYLFR